MNKRFIIFIFILLNVISSCVTVRYENDLKKVLNTYNIDKPLQVSIFMPDTIDLLQKDILIYLEAENMTAKEMNINNLSNWYYAHPQLLMNDSLVDCDIRVNSHPEKDYYILGNHEKRRFIYDFSFDKIYSLKKIQPGEYRLQFIISPFFDYPHIGFVSSCKTIILI